MANDYTASINRVVWSPDGTLFGKCWCVVYVLLYSHFVKVTLLSKFFKNLKMLTQVYTTGVAYSKHIVHIYSYHGGDDLRNHLEVCPSNNPLNLVIS